MMKIYLAGSFSCDLNFQHIYIEYKLNELCEVVDDPSIADCIVFPAICAGSLQHIELQISYMNSIISEKGPNTKVIMTGCLSREFTKESNEIYFIKEWINQNIDKVYKQNDYKQLVYDITGDFSPKEMGAVIASQDELGKFAGVYVANGCLNHCSFCKLTYQHYPLTSAKIEDVKAWIDRINENNIPTVQLIATNLTQYGLDLYGEYKLGEILNYIETKENIKHVQLYGFSYKDAINSHLEETLKKTTKVIGIDGSLESGSNKILKLMNKGITKETFEQFLMSFNSDNKIVLQLSIIAGFPTETKEDVKETIDLLKKVRADYVNICFYTDSPFVDSHELPQLNPEEIEQHALMYKKAIPNSKRIGGK